MPLPSRPRHPEENGVQERSGGYVKDNALKGRRFQDWLEELNRFLVQCSMNACPALRASRVAVVARRQTSVA